MKNLLTALGAAVLLAACATQQTGTTTTQQTAQTQSAAPEPKGRRLEILFLGDNGHHQPSKMAPYAMAALGSRGINFTYTDRLEDVIVHTEVRGWEKPSDHVPVEGVFTF